MIREIHYQLVAGHILYHGIEQQLTPAWMTQELDEHGYEYGHDDVESIMRDLVAKGLLDTDEDEYWTTDDGRSLLDDLKQKAATFSDEVLAAD